MSARLSKKVAIITGAAHGIGAEEARLFAREGASVVLSDIDGEAGESVAEEIRQAGGNARFARADVTKEHDWRSILDTCLTWQGRLDVLVNNAGISSTSFSDHDSVDGWRSLLDANATSCFLGTRFAVPEMRKAGGGAIVNTSSIMGLIGSDSGHPAYHASKGAVRLYTKACAVRYGKYNIRVNSIHPGFMGAMQSARPSKERMDRMIEATPLHRIGRSSEVAYAALFLSSDEASFITGTELVVDGGFTVQ